MTDTQAERELEVVERFLIARGMPRRAFSIEKRQPPEPDVLVCQSDGSCVALELVEILEQNYAHNRCGSDATKAAIEKFIGDLPSMASARFKAKYGDAHLFFRFVRGSTLNRRRRVFAAAFDKLLGLDDDFTGVALEQDATLSGVLTSVRIARGGFRGPIFSVPSGGSVADPTTRRIQGKFAKTYATNHPIALLAYVDLNPMFPEVVWRGNLLDFLDAQARPLPFERVWVFDYQASRLLLEYPTCDLQLRVEAFRGSLNCCVG